MSKRPTVHDSEASRAEQTRSRLLAAAIEQFAARGFHATRVSDIVAAAGVTQPAFYLYFASKQALFDDLIRQFRDQLRAAALTLRTTGQPTREAFTAQFGQTLVTIYQLLAAQPALTRLVLFQNPQASAVRTDLIALFYYEIQRAQRARLVHARLDAEVASVAIVGMVEHLSEFWLLSGEKSPESLASAHADLILGGLLIPLP